MQSYSHIPLECCIISGPVDYSPRARAPNEERGARGARRSRRRRAIHVSALLVAALDEPGWAPKHTDAVVRTGILECIHRSVQQRAHLVHCRKMSTTASSARGRASTSERIVVTEDMKQSFRESGYATTLSSVVDDAELERMRACYDGLYDNHSYGQDKRGLVQIFGAAQLAPDLISQELFERANHAAVEMLAALDGIHPAYHSSTSQVQTRSATNTMGCICKPALTSEFTEFHQDEAYSPADVERWGVTAQLTLQPNDEQSGQVAISSTCTSKPATRCGSRVQGLTVVASHHLDLWRGQVHVLYPRIPQTTSA
jgi:hypothetical protein